VAALLHSGATTGLPAEGDADHHFNLVANLVQMQTVERMAAEEVVIGVILFHHIYDFNVVLNLTLHAGTTGRAPSLHLEEFLRAVQEHSVTTAFLVPPIVRTSPTIPWSSDTTSSLRYLMSAAARCRKDGPRRAPVPGCVIKQAYGLTETSPRPIDAARRGASEPAARRCPAPSAEGRRG
jgi:acyl-CoA synthetase (AMP-forming)/AMP-acid ligase II